MLNLSKQVNVFSVNNTTPKDNYMMKKNTENGIFIRVSGEVKVYGATDAFTNHEDVSWSLITTMDTNQTEATFSWNDFSGIYMESDTEQEARVCPLSGSIESYYSEIIVESIADFEDVPALPAGGDDKALRVKPDGTLEWADLEDSVITAPNPMIIGTSGVDTSGANFLLEIEGSGLLPQTKIYIFKGYSFTNIEFLEGYISDDYVDLISAGHYSEKSNDYDNELFFTSDGMVMNGEGHTVTKTDSSEINPFAYISGNKIKVCLSGSIQSGLYCIVAVNPGGKKFATKTGFYIA